MKTICAALVSALTLATNCMPADFDIRNEKEFHKCIPDDAIVKRLATGMQFTEGPVWVPEGAGYLVFSDIPANELKRWTEDRGVITYRKPSNNANGNTLDRHNNLITCEHSGRRIMIEERSIVRPVVERYNGVKFNSPNDAVVKFDGTVWFTDPDYGLAGNRQELDGHFVFRFEPRTRQIDPVAKDFDQPNGLCFSPDQSKLYIADSGRPHHIRVFDVQRDGTLANGRVFCTIDNGGPDGIRCDKAGRIWSSAGDGMHIFAPDGSLIGKILTPETPANLCFGGANGKRLFITARSSLYAIDTRVKGAR